MLVIRLRRMGSKKRPYFRMVVTESTAARDGRFVEVLGHYNPRSVPEKVEVKRDRLAYWLGNGARPSDTVRTLVARHKLEAPVEAPVAPAAESVVEQPAS
jgi:small subunit ribosomal protein S16